MALRAQLSAKPTDEWQKAKCLMDELTRVLGQRGGPMGGSIAPRACVYAVRPPSARGVWEQSAERRFCLAADRSLRRLTIEGLTRHVLDEWRQAASGGVSAEVAAARHERRVMAEVAGTAE